MKVTADKRKVVANDDDAIQTYRFLRLGMLVAVSLILVAQAQEWVVTGDVESSISAYFYTSVHGIFVGALFILGACLIIYRGSGRRADDIGSKSSKEDAVLNFSGFLAFFVATMPTTPVKYCKSSELPGCSKVAEGTSTGLWALVIVWIAVEVGFFVMTSSETLADIRRYFNRIRVARLVTLTVMVIYFCAPRGLYDFLHLPWSQVIFDNRHNMAAVSMFLGIVYVVFVNAKSAKASSEPRAQRAGRWYRFISRLMVLTIAAVIISHIVNRIFYKGWIFEHDVILLEWLLIAEFAAYWLVQTVELWNVDNRDALPASESSEPQT